MIGEDAKADSHTNIPLYADGYPGIMFQQSENGFFILPKEKQLSELFLYGQTINPISLDVKGPHNYVVVQLYPFASKYLLNVDPKALNDECYDLLQIQYLDIANYQKQLVQAGSLTEKVRIISNLMRALIRAHNVHENDQIQQAISIIIDTKGQIKVKELLQQLHLTERTFERNFKSHVGLSPKQFAKIIQFQSALNQLTATNFKKLTDVGFDNGFTDQSHFIRTFKNYTDKPLLFIAKIFKSTPTLSGLYNFQQLELHTFVLSLKQIKVYSILQLKILACPFLVA